MTYGTKSAQGLPDARMPEHDEREILRGAQASDK